MIRLINWIYVKIRYLKFSGKGKVLNMLWKAKQYFIKRKYEKKNI